MYLSAGPSFSCVRMLYLCYFKVHFVFGYPLNKARNLKCSGEISPVKPTDSCSLCFAVTYRSCLSNMVWLIRIKAAKWRGLFSRIVQSLKSSPPSHTVSLSRSHCCLDRSLVWSGCVRLMLIWWTRQIYILDIDRSLITKENDLRLSDLCHLWFAVNPMFCFFYLIFIPLSFTD